MCYSLWYNAPAILPAGGRATSSVHYTTSCNTQSSAPQDWRDHSPKHVELIGTINKPLLLHLGGFYVSSIALFFYERNLASSVGGIASRTRHRHPAIHQTWTKTHPVYS